MIGWPVGGLLGAHPLEKGIGFLPFNIPKQSMYGMFACIWVTCYLLVEWWVNMPLYTCCIHS